MVRKASTHASATYKEPSNSASNLPRLIAIISCIAAIGSMVYGVRRANAPQEGTALAMPEATPMVVSATPLSPGVEEPAPLATPLPSVEPMPASPNPRIGIVAGHWGSDTGAVCPDGLQEVDVNLDIARRVVSILGSLGYEADLMEEFDPRLRDYWAYGLLSIHADSCEPFPGASPPASGFKVARVQDSLVPEEEDRLVGCLSQCYAARTGMYFHATSVTVDMTRYHTFYEIDARTPAAIIETGFMLNDRELLTYQPDLVAQGIVDGLICFLEGTGLH